ncbi:hypothetical protein B7494_g3325 [Chlorociboria aeruginascens]|nr:hypothetical protein B7494_g3325 [Chlorociboria aeruginascens]
MQPLGVICGKGHYLIPPPANVSSTLSTFNSSWTQVSCPADSTSIITVTASITSTQYVTSSDTVTTGVPSSFANSTGIYTATNSTSIPGPSGSGGSSNAFTSHDVPYSTEASSNNITSALLQTLSSSSITMTLASGSGGSISASVESTSSIPSILLSTSSETDMVSATPVTVATGTDLHPATTVVATTTVTGGLQTTTPNAAAVHCGLHGLPVGDYFLAEFVEDKDDVAVTLSGCYSFCAGVYGISMGCMSYDFYPEEGTGAPRCDLYGGSVAQSLDSTNNYVPNVQIHADRRFSPGPYDSGSPKLRVENLHYDLTEVDLDVRFQKGGLHRRGLRVSQDLFNRIGPVAKLSLTYDRAGRSEGIAYVTYESVQDARRAIREFDGANANGQPIRLISIPAGPSAGRRNPFENAVMPPRSLAERITYAPGRARSLSPIRHSDVSGPPPDNVDRYVPGKGSRSRSPIRRRRDGRRPGARKERAERGGGRSGEKLSRDGRPKKTQEELDAEMEDYWGTGSKDTANGTEAPAAGPSDDVDMIE